MNKVASTDFRRSFHKLREPVEVTVMGHTIGTYLPIGSKTPDKAVPVETKPAPALSPHDILSRVNRAR